MMKKTILAMAVFAFMTTSISSSFGQNPVNEPIKTDVKIQDAPKDTNSDFQKFKKESELRIKNIENIIGELKVFFYQNKIKNKIAFQDNLNLLEEKNDNLNKKLAEYKDNDQSTLTSLKVEIKQVLVEIAKALKTFEADNK
jgi:hypothetical protein